MFVKISQKKNASCQHRYSLIKKDCLCLPDEILVQQLGKIQVGLNIVLILAHLPTKAKVFEEQEEELRSLWFTVDVIVVGIPHKQHLQGVDHTLGNKLQTPSTHRWRRLCLLFGNYVTPKSNLSSAINRIQKFVGGQSKNRLSEILNLVVSKIKLAEFSIQLQSYLPSSARLRQQTHQQNRRNISVCSHSLWQCCFVAIDRRNPWK